MMRYKLLWLSVAVSLLISLTIIPSCTRPTSTVSTTTTSPTITTTSAITTTSTITTTYTSIIEVGEATEFQGVELTPISQQRNNALAGTQHIDESTYTLTVNGLVDKPLTLTYADLQALPQISKLATLPCVEGWSFNAKWTGPSLSDILDEAGVQPDAKIVIFHTTDVPGGYTSLTITDIRAFNMILALKLNDITLPQDRGFPFQVVAEGKFGYKWAKWVTSIEVSSNTDFRGFWESVGYSNDGFAGAP